MPRKPKLNPEQVAEVWEMYRGPYKIRQIARYFGVDPAIIHRVLNRKGPYAKAEQSTDDRA